MTGRKYFTKKRRSASFTKDGIQYTVRAYCIKTNLSLVSTSKMKRLVNSSSIFVLMIIKDKYFDKTDVFKHCDPKLKDELVKVVGRYDAIFQEPKGLPPKRKK